MLPASSLQANVVGVFASLSQSGFCTQAQTQLTLDLQGIPGDRHYGFTRPAGARERWYQKGTQMRSGRQITIVSVEELAEIARLLDIPHIEPEALGANILLEGVDQLSLLPWGTRLFFEGGATLVNEGINAPCRYAGAEIAKSNPNRSKLDLDFVKFAKNLRGLVASVERMGNIMPGPVRLKIPAQNIWNPGRLL